eukprot:Nk52_evm46s1737 gene=Nk52_evmTU46s1737
MEAFSDSLQKLHSLEDDHFLRLKSDSYKNMISADIQEKYSASTAHVKFGSLECNLGREEIRFNFENCDLVRFCVVGAFKLPSSEQLVGFTWEINLQKKNRRWTSNVEYHFDESISAIDNARVERYARCIPIFFGTVSKIRCLDAAVDRQISWLKYDCLSLELRERNNALLTALYIFSNAKVVNVDSIMYSACFNFRYEIEHLADIQFRNLLAGPDFASLSDNDDDDLPAFL